MSADAPVFIQPPKQLFGVSDQASPPTLLSVTTYQRNSSTAIMTGSAAFNIQSADLDQFSDSELTKDAVGSPRQLSITGEGISLKLSVVPEGSTINEAILAGSVPPKGAYVKIANGPVMAFGPFAASANSGGGAINSKNWQVQSARLALKAGARGEVEMELFQYVSASMNNPNPPA